MAALGFCVQTAKISTGTALKSLIQLLAPSNQRIKIREWSISFDGTSNTATPILVELVRQTSAGTFTNTTTIRKLDNDLPETLQTTCKDTATAEPTDSGDVPFSELVHPQQGYTWQAPFGGEIIIKGGERLGLRVTAGASVNAVVRMVGEE
jgi:hypothetical protein